METLSSRTTKLVGGIYTWLPGATKRGNGLAVLALDACQLLSHLRHIGTKRQRDLVHGIISPVSMCTEAADWFARTTTPSRSDSWNHRRSGIGLLERGDELSSSANLDTACLLSSSGQVAFPHILTAPKMANQRSTMMAYSSLALHLQTDRQTIVI
jgi:hypothetical protein